jgi:hypothetical protein
LSDLVQPPYGMRAIELDDGQRVLASEGRNPAAVKRRLAKGKHHHEGGAMNIA